MDENALIPSIELRTVSGVHIELPVAGIGSRSYAFTIDWHIRLLVALGWWLIAMIIASGGFDFTEVSMPDTSPMREMHVFLVYLMPFVIYFFYHPVLEIVMKGRTPGKRMAGLRIVARNGEPAKAGALLTRNVFRLIDSMPAFYGVGIISALFTRDSVRIGDLAAGTVLVHEEKLDRQRLMPLLAQTGGDTKMRELIADLLDRWKELDEATRVRLADALLARHGISATQGGPMSAMSHDRRKQLEQLLRGAA